MAGVSPLPAGVAERPHGPKNFDLFSAVAELRWRMLVNSLRTVRGRLELVSRVVVGLSVTMLAVGGAALMAAAGLFCGGGTSSGISGHRAVADFRVLAALSGVGIAGVGAIRIRDVAAISDDFLDVLVAGIFLRADRAGLPGEYFVACWRCSAESRWRGRRYCPGRRWRWCGFVLANLLFRGRSVFGWNGGWRNARRAKYWECCFFS